MCDQTSHTYEPNDVVWVKLSNVWWPAEVQDMKKLDDDVTSGLKKQPIAIVKFFNEDFYEYIKSLDQIYHYNCQKKNDFIIKGLEMSCPSTKRSTSSKMKKFPDDVKQAEISIGGNPGIFSEPPFKPYYDRLIESTSSNNEGTPKTHIKRARVVQSVSEPTKRARHSLPSQLSKPETDFVFKTPLPPTPQRLRQLARAATEPSRPAKRRTDSIVGGKRISGTPLTPNSQEIRSVTQNKSFRSVILVQPGPQASTPENQEKLYRCFRCFDSTNRLNVLIDHYKAHETHGDNLPPMIQSESPTYSSSSTGSSSFPGSSLSPGSSRDRSLSTPKVKMPKVKPTKSKKPLPSTTVQKHVKKEENVIQTGNDDITVETTPKKKTANKKTPKPKKNKDDDQLKVLREKLLKDWDDESDDDATSGSKVFSTTAEIHFSPSQQSDNSFSSENASSDESATSIQENEIETTGSTTKDPEETPKPEYENVQTENDIKLDLPSADQIKNQDEEKSCFDFVEDNEEAINLDKSHKFGQKLPRVLNEDKLKKFVATDNETEQSVSAEDSDLESKVQELLEETQVTNLLDIPGVSSVTYSLRKKSKDVDGNLFKSNSPEKRSLRSQNKRSGSSSIEVKVNDELNENNTNTNYLQDLSVKIEKEGNYSEKKKRKKIPSKKINKKRKIQSQGELSDQNDSELSEMNNEAEDEVTSENVSRANQLEDKYNSEVKGNLESSMKPKVTDSNVKVPSENDETLPSKQDHNKVLIESNEEESIVLEQKEVINEEVKTLVTLENETSVKCDSSKEDVLNKEMLLLNKGNEPDVPEYEASKEETITDLLSQESFNNLIPPSHLEEMNMPKTETSHSKPNIENQEDKITSTMEIDESKEDAAESSEAAIEGDLKNIVGEEVEPLVVNVSANSMDTQSEFTDKEVHEEQNTSEFFLDEIHNEIETYVELESKDVDLNDENLSLSNKMNDLVPAEISNVSTCESVEADIKDEASTSGQSEINALADTNKVPEDKLKSADRTLKINDALPTGVEKKSNKLPEIGNVLYEKADVSFNKSSENCKTIKNSSHTTKTTKTLVSPIKGSHGKHYPVLDIQSCSNETEISAGIPEWTVLEYYADLEAQVRNDLDDDDKSLVTTSVANFNSSSADSEPKSINTEEVVDYISINKNKLKSKNENFECTEDNVKELLNQNKLDDSTSPCKNKPTESSKSRVVYDFKLENPELTINEIPPKQLRTKKRKWESKESVGNNKFVEIDVHLDSKLEEGSCQDNLIQEQTLTKDLDNSVENIDVSKEQDHKKLKMESESFEMKFVDESAAVSTEVHDEIEIPNEAAEMKEIVVQTSEPNVLSLPQDSFPAVSQEISSEPKNEKETATVTLPPLVPSSKQQETVIAVTDSQLNFSNTPSKNDLDSKVITTFDPSQLELDINSMPVVIEEDLMQDLKLTPVTSTVVTAPSTKSNSNMKPIRIQLRKAGETNSLDGNQNGKIIRIPGPTKEPSISKKPVLPGTSKIQTVSKLQPPRTVTTNNPTMMLKVNSGQSKLTVGNQIKGASTITSGQPLKFQIIQQGSQGTKIFMQPQQKPFGNKLAPRLITKGQVSLPGVSPAKTITTATATATKTGQKVIINQKRIMPSKNIITKTGTIAVSKTTSTISTQKTGKSIVVAKSGLPCAKNIAIPTIQGSSGAQVLQVVGSSVPSKVIMQRRTKSLSGTGAPLKSLPSQSGTIFLHTNHGLVPSSPTVTNQILNQIPHISAPSAVKHTPPLLTNVKRAPLNKSRQAQVNILQRNQKKGGTRLQTPIQSQPQQQSKQSVMSISASSISSHELILNNVPLQLQNIGAGQSSDVKMLYLVDEQGQYHQVDNSSLITIDNSGDSRNVFIDPNSANNEVDNLFLTFSDAGVVNVTTSAATPSQDILAKALANTQVLQSDSTDLPEPEMATLYVESPQYQTPPTLTHSVLETSFSLNPPIMTPLEVPSTISPQVTSISTSLIPSQNVETVVKKADAQPSMPLLTDDVDLANNQTVYFDSTGLVSGTSQPLTFQVINTDGRILAESDDLLPKRLAGSLTERKGSSEDTETQNSSRSTDDDKAITSFTFTQPIITREDPKFVEEEKR